LNWRDDFQIALHIQDDVRIVRSVGNIFLTNIHRVYLGSVPEPSLEDDNLSDYFLSPFGRRPAGATTDSKTDLGEIVREIEELAVFNDEAHHSRPTRRHRTDQSPGRTPLHRGGDCRSAQARRLARRSAGLRVRDGPLPRRARRARNKGLDLTPKYIPAEVFDKRAVEKGQVVFHDVSFVEATPRYDKRNKRAVRIELTDFSVYYTQGAAEAAIAAMKEGKSEVVCEQGQLYKVSKSKTGVVDKEQLTKRWTDWVDYWAVDFDYMQRREIIKVPVGTGLSGVAMLPGFEPPQAELTLPQFEERWTGGYIFENEWQSFRTRQDRELERITAEHTYEQSGRYTVAVKVIDIFGIDTMTLVPVSVG
jgi:site-specific DNA-methyltransferase (adenine-specific)/adenine-specific DNA-methyltransferase